MTITQTHYPEIGDLNTAAFDQVNLPFLAAENISAPTKVNATMFKKFYLPQLDGLRFIAFFLVFLHHFPSAAGYFKENSIFAIFAKKLSTFGWMGVDIFLCLSSFLLTSLLILEYQKTKTISIKNFYIRRALRIWPLYYLILILAFAVFPACEFISPAIHSQAYWPLVKKHLLPYTFFLGNLSYAYNSSIAPVSTPIAALWTISLEEQFYLFWPILLFVLLPLSKKLTFGVLIGIIAFSCMVKCYIIANDVPYPTIWVFTLARMDPFAFGAMISFIYIYSDVKPRPMLACGLAAILFACVMQATQIGGKSSVWQLIAVAVGGSLLIYGGLYSERLKQILSFPPIVWLGKISFGLYVFHYMIIAVMADKTLLLVSHYLPKGTQPFLEWLIAAGLTFLTTIFFASVSYYFFEARFLKLKDRYVSVSSRPI